MLSTEWIPPDVSPLQADIQSSLTFIPQCNVDFNIDLIFYSNWNLHSFSKKQSMIRNTKAIDLVIRSDGTNYSPFGQIFDSNKSESCVQKKEDFSPSVFLIQMETIPGLRI
jgi:hypothetical protein